MKAKHVVSVSLPYHSPNICSESSRNAATPTRLPYKRDCHLIPVSTMLLVPTLLAMLCLWQPLVFAAAASSALSPRYALSNPGDRIVGGQAADIKDFNYQLSLREYFHHTCGASIISESYAVSAAHCVYQRSSFCEKVVGGSTDLNDVFHQVWYKVKKNNVHPSFNSENLDYDISVLSVWPKFRLGNRLNPIALPAVNSFTPVGASVVVSGWGLQAENAQKISNKLLFTTVQIQDFAKCNKSYEGILTSRMLCASSPGKDACQGDSGGPLVSKTSSRPCLIGIVSFGQGCAEGAFPGVYTNISCSGIRSFIQQIAGV